MKYKIIALILLPVLFLYTRPRYILYLPTLPVYDKDEAGVVLRKSQNRTIMDERFFALTDPSVTYAFLDHVEESEKTLRKMITSPLVMGIIYLFKYLINRPRPYQINKDIKPLDSRTGDTPAMPAGHAFQAYYLATVLSRKYPDKKQLFSNIARRCDMVRIKGGIHYPSDGKLSESIVDLMIKIGLF